MRLIDADALCEKIRKIYDGYMFDEGGSTPSDFENMVDDMPTAFDTEKVVEKLEEMKNNKDCQVYCYEFYKKKCMIHEKVIDIVKKGGVE